MSSEILSPIELAQRSLLAPAGLANADLERVFAQVMGPGVDAADLYFQRSRSEQWVLEDGIVKDGTHAIEQGVGIRAISGEKTGFAYSDEIVLPALVEAGRAARAIAREGQAHPGQALKVASGRSLYRPLDPLDSLGNAAKVDLLRQVDAFTRALDPRVQQVIVSLAGSVETVLVAASDGTLAGDVRPLVRCNVQVIVEANGRREQGSAGGGGRHDYGRFLAE